MEATAEADELENEVTISFKAAVAMYGAGAVLGPLLDHQHSRFDVLHYASPSQLALPAALRELCGEASAAAADALPLWPSAAWEFLAQRETGTLETCWWVPLLFGGAAVILGVGHTALDDLRHQWAAAAKSESWTDSEAVLLPPNGGWAPSWAFVNLAISSFCMQYFASGALAGPLRDVANDALPVRILDLVLAVWAVFQWAVFDCTSQGAFMAVLCGTVGPITEIGLINVGHLYTYSDPDFAGIPAWICWVYACGAPAVGNLGRRVRASLDEQAVPRPRPPSKEEAQVTAKPLVDAYGIAAQRRLSALRAERTAALNQVAEIEELRALQQRLEELELLANMVASNRRGKEGSPSLRPTAGDRVRAGLARALSKVQTVVEEAVASVDPTPVPAAGQNDEDSEGVSEPQADAVVERTTSS